MAFDINSAVSVKERKQQAAPKQEDKLKERISQRKSGFEMFLEETQKPLTAKSLIPGVATLSGAKGALGLVGGAGQAIEASLANPLMALFDEKDDSPKEVVDDFLQGITSQQLGEFGDVVRQTGFGGRFNEPIAAGAGLITSVMTGNILSGGKVVGGTKKMLAAMKKARVRGVVKGAIKSRRFFKDKADEFFNGFDEAFGAMRDSFNDVYKHVGDDIINGESKAIAQDIVNRSPERVLNAVKKNVQITGKELKPNINTLKTIKTEIGRTIPKKVWSGLEEATEVQAKMMDDYFKLNDLIAENIADPKMAEGLIRLNKKFSRLHNFSRGIKPSLKTSAGITKTTIKDLDKPTQQGLREAMRRFSNGFFKDGRAIMDDVSKFNRVQKRVKTAKTLAKRGGVALGGGLLLKSLLRPTFEEVGITQPSQGIQ